MRPRNVTHDFDREVDRDLKPRADVREFEAGVRPPAVWGRSGALETELLDRSRVRSRKQARTAVSDFIGAWHKPAAPSLDD